MNLKDFKAYNAERDRNLILGIVFDAVGMMSFSIPFIGEFADVIWAPVSGMLMMWMYKGTTGKLAGVLSMAEEILPFADIIPSFTLTWLYKYKFQKQPELDKSVAVTQIK